MDALRDYIRTHLARSLASADPEARLTAAWTVAAGRAMAARASIAAYDPTTSTVRILVADRIWLEPLSALRPALTRDLASISGIPVKQIDFQLDKRPPRRI